MPRPLRRFFSSVGHPENQAGTGSSEGQNFKNHGGTAESLPVQIRLPGLLDPLIQLILKMKRLSRLQLWKACIDQELNAEFLAAGSAVIIMLKKCLLRIVVEPVLQKIRNQFFKRFVIHGQKYSTETGTAEARSAHPRSLFPCQCIRHSVIMVSDFNLSASEKHKIRSVQCSAKLLWILRSHFVRNT